MSRSIRLAQSLPILVAAGTFAAITGRSGLAAVGLLILALGCLRPTTTRIPAAGEALIGLGCAIGVMLVYLYEPNVRGLGRRPLQALPLVVAGGALWMAAVRVHLWPAEGGPPLTLGLGLLVLLGCGGTNAGNVYPACTIAYALCAWGALRVVDLQASVGRGLGWRHAIGALGVLALAALLGGSMAKAVPVASRKVSAWAIRKYEEHMMSRSGFRDGAIALGSLRGMLQSDEVVLRVHGPTEDHLRGNVYTDYQSGRWRPSVVRAGLQEWASLELEGNGETRIEFVGGDSDRFFLPAGAEQLRIAPTRARVDPFGVLRSDADEPPQSAEFVLGVGQLPSAPPSGEDLALPPNLRAELEALAREWTAGIRDPEAALAAIEARLERDYVYSLEYERPRAGDPVRHFLWEERQGHCEYFASAMALLARAVDVPARVVTGYRPTEVNPLAGYTIVRERNAHAWVEAHVPGRGWITVDPSPGESFAAGFRSQSTLGVGLVDGAVVVLRRYGTSLMLALLALVFASIQLARLLKDSGGRREATSLASGPPELEALLQRLRDLGIGRAHNECLSALAQRMQDYVAHRRELPETPAIASAVPLVQRYALLRYGPEASSPGFEREVSAWLGRTPPRAPG